MSVDLSEVVFPDKVAVTRQKVDVSVLNDAQRDFYLDLFRRVLSVYEKADKPRVIIGIVGPTGSGKSVIASLFREIARQVELPFQFEAVGVDAFHYPNDYLLSHESGGEVLKDHKGWFDTYDVSKLTQSLRSFAEGEDVTLPVYSRETHDPVEDAVAISQPETLLFVEGLWLLYDKHGWEEIKEYLDFSIFIEADKEAAREDVIQRHVRGGRSVEEASEYYDTVDAESFDAVMATRDAADQVIPSYRKIKETAQQFT